VRTSGLGRFKLGQPLPAQTHAVCVSLPEVKDLIGYEEKDPTTLAAMPTGYPRFVRHRMIDQMIRELCKESPPSTHGYLFTKETDCEEVIKRYSLQDTKVRRTQEYTLLEIPSASPAKDGVTSYFQHTGCGISSRLAEDFLWDRGLLEKRETL
jgi:cystathionine gamma-synthase